MRTEKKVNVHNLTDRQKALLIDLINSIFDKEYHLIQTDTGIFVESKMGLKFHWFEFVMTILAENTIMYNLQGIGDLAYTTMLGTVHPVDFIYERSKQKQLV